MTNPYFLEKRRAMVSLGPISNKAHCPYQCEFCYVYNENFTKYSSLSVKDIITWLKDNENEFDVIYISGDTDSFAKPRTEKGIELLNECAKLNKDVLFTTRYVFSDSEAKELTRIGNILRANGNLAIGCISVCQFTQNNLEPYPIKPPLTRIAELEKYLNCGWIPILSMRPILPSVPVSDYLNILDSSYNYTNNVLISSFFYNSQTSHLVKEEESVLIDNLYFNITEGGDWREWRIPIQTAAILQQKCDKLGVSLFERSDQLYLKLKQ